MDFRQYVPSQALKKYVRYFWSYDVRKEQHTTFRIKSFADKYPRIIFQNLENFESLRSLDGQFLPMCYLSGIDTQHSDAVVKGSFSHFGVSLFPYGLAAFFKEPPSGLVNTIPDIQMICSQGVQLSLATAKDHHQRVSIISRYLLEKLTQSSPDELIIDLFHHHGLDDRISIDLLRKKYAVSERCLQRRFKASVGISHKKYQRILRFEKSLKLLKDASYSELTSIAYDLRYNDQSHFIKEFTEFSGMSPYAFVKSESIGSESSSFVYMG